MGTLTKLSVQRGAVRPLDLKCHYGAAVLSVEAPVNGPESDPLTGREILS